MLLLLFSVAIIIIISLIILPFLTSSWCWLGFLVSSPDPMVSFQSLSLSSYFAISTLYVDRACHAMGANSDEVVKWDKILASRFTEALNRLG